MLSLVDRLESVIHHRFVFSPSTSKRVLNPLHIHKSPVLVYFEIVTRFVSEGSGYDVDT